MAAEPAFLVLTRDTGKFVPEGGGLLHPDRLDDEQAKKADFLVLDASDATGALEMLRMVRGHPDTKIYLKPVVLGAGPAQAHPILREAVDVVGRADPRVRPVAPEQEEFVHHILASRHYRQKIPNVLGQEQLSLRLLRFMASRDEVEQRPVQTINALGGYSYPKLDMFFPEEDASIWELLEELRKQHLIEGRFITRAFHCVHCECAFLNFMETCPDCGSPNLESEEMIHHFRCGYVAAMSEYRQGDVLVCPKCDLGLKHIGVDYDKPSLIFRCNDCRFLFEEPEPSTVCYNCGRRTAPEDQIQRTVRAYSITALGSNVALFGQEQLFDRLLKENLDLIDNESFFRIVKMEMERIQRYGKSTSNLLILEIANLTEAMSRLGDRGVEFYHDMINEIAAEIRASDMMTIVDRSTLNILLTETDARGADMVTRRIIQRLDAIFQEALSMPSGAKGRISPVKGATTWDESMAN